MEETEAFRGQVTCSQYRSREQRSQDSNPDPRGTKISALNPTRPGKRTEVAYFPLWILYVSFLWKVNSCWRRKGRKKARPALSFCSGSEEGRSREN